MREQLNNNPTYQIGAFGLLAVIGLLYFMVLRGGDEPVPAPPAVPGVPGAVAPGTATAPGAATGPLDGSAAGASGGLTAPIELEALEPGKGLPLDLVKAYAEDQTIVIFVAAPKSVAAERLEKSAKVLDGRKDTKVFHYTPKQVAKISRVSLALQLNRVPAMITIVPRSLTDSVPTATVAYGYRGSKSVLTQVKDANYRGPTNLPRYP